jgi:phenylacetate-CoA ligase
MYFDADYETMPREELAQLQLERLQSTLTRVARNVPMYRAKFMEADIDPDDFRSLDDVVRLPFTDKAELCDNQPYGLFAVPLREVVRLQASSGTTGKAVIVGYTKNDVERWAKLTARILVMGGVTRDDMVQIAFPYGLFTGGFGFHYGAERLGASVIPASGGNTDRQIQIIQDYKTTALICTPGYALHIAETLYEMGVNANALTLKWGLFGAERWSENMRAEIEDKLKITATDNYGLSEIMGPGIAGECMERSGMHLCEDHFLAEIIDPETQAPLPVGETGELVLTTLSKEAFPLIRFRTGDLTRIMEEPCPCGRTHRKIDRIKGRCDDMFVIHGMNIYPSMVDQVLSEIQGVDPCCRIEISRKGALDEAAVLVTPASDTFDEIRVSEGIRNTIQKKLKSALGVTFQVRLAERSTVFDDASCKVQKVVDRRDT